MSTNTEQLTRTIRWLQVYAALMTVALAVLFVRSGTPPDGVLRVRGLVIEDDAGRERILIGAPVPEAANRVRTDTARVRQIWGPRFSDRYMGYYQDYDHAANGIVILSEDGFDRVVLGDPVPDPNIGKRIGPSTGLVINDVQGFERTGYGIIYANDSWNVGLSLDSDRGEGLILALDKDGMVVVVGDGEDRILLGSASAGHRWTARAEPFLGLAIMEDGEIVHELNVAKDK